MKYSILFFLNLETSRTWTHKRVYWGRIFYDCSYLEILGDGDKYKTSFYTDLY